VVTDPAEGAVPKFSGEDTPEKPGPSPVLALGADLVIPLLALAFAIYFLVDVRELGWEAKANGVGIGTVLLVLIAVQLVRIALKLRRGEGGLSFAPLLEPREALGKRVALVAVTIAFILTLKWLGLTLGLFLGMLAALWLMGVRKPRQLFGISFVVAAAAYGLFIAALESSFPHGPVESLIASLL
jgi:hypothetical protein